MLYDGRLLMPSFKDEWYFAGDELRRRLLPTIEKLAEKPFNVLVEGETGTGKELIARHLHQHSLRKDAKYTTLNVAALAESVFESELFGHTKGSYTGATSGRTGILEESDKGMLFFDEIGDLGSSAQKSLLRFLQNGEIKKVGSNEVKNVDVRIIAATNQNLDILIESNKFREDLYYRLNQLSVKTVPLRETKTDIPHLLGYFISKYEEWFNGNLNNAIVPAQLTRLLCEFEWPGNTRQLENSVRRFAGTENVYDLIPTDYRDFFRFIDTNIKEGHGLGNMLKVIAVNYIDTAERVWKKNGLDLQDTSDLVLGIGDWEIEGVKKDPKRFQDLKRPLYHYQGLKNLLSKYAKKKLPLSYVLTKFTRAYTGVRLELHAKYPENLEGRQDGEQIADINFDSVYKKIGNPPCSQDDLRGVMEGKTKLRLSHLNF